MNAEAGMRATHRRWGEAAIGLATVAFAGVAAWQASQIPSEGVGSSVGPNVVPWIVAGMLGVLGLALAGTALLARRPDKVDAGMGAGANGNAETDHGEIDWRGAGWMLLGLLLNVALIEHLGFILSSALLFVCTARAFGSARPARDAGIGLTLALGAYIGFDRLLGYKIGSGLIERLI
jgi:putative tricarboxylic transport membrane protein